MVKRIERMRMGGRMKEGTGQEGQREGREGEWRMRGIILQLYNVKFSRRSANVHHFWTEKVKLREGQSAYMTQWSLCHTPMLLLSSCSVGLSSDDG